MANFSSVKMILCNDTSINLGGKDSLQNFKTEPYYNLKWSVINNINVDSKKQFDFHVEKENPYLTINPIVNKNITKVSDQEIPRKVELISNKMEKKDCSTNQIWFGNTDEFNEAIVYTNSVFTNIDFVTDIEKFVFIKIFSQYMNYKFSIKFNLENELGYVCSLGFKFNHSKIELFISGWNEKFSDYFISVMKYIKNEFKYDSNDKEMIKTLFKNMEDEYLKITKENPWQFSDYIFSLNSYENRFNYQTILKYLGNDFNKEKLITKFTKQFGNIKNLILNESHFKFFM